VYLVKFAIFEGLALSSFEHATHHNEGEAMKAVAHLPGLDIEIVHHQSSDGLAEQISINLKAARLVWFPWVEAMRAAMVQQGPTTLPKRRPALPGSQHEVL
jgi:hypothetical protein